MLQINKFNSFSASILKNTNRLVCCSNDNLGAISKGSYLKIGNDDILYQTLNSKKFFLTKDFEVINNRTIKINSNTEINLQKEDNIKIIFDEYKLGAILNINKSGRLYREGDILTVKGGELSINISSGIGSPTKLKVEEVGEFNSILKLSKESEGKYIIPPQGKLETYGGNGEGLEIELEYKILDTRNIQERVIKNIEFKDDETFITLDYSLPLGIKKGNLSIEKWEVFLASNYCSENKFYVDCSIYRDFTPHINLPLINKNSTTFDMLVNKAFFTIDEKVRKLEDRISALERRNR